MTAITLDEIDTLAGGKIGTHDVACPECGPVHRGPSARRKVLRVWRKDEDFASYYCARCEATGYAIRGGARRRRVYQPSRPPKPAPVCDVASQSDRSELALMIWRSSKPAAGTVVETYLRSRGLNISPPAALRFHSTLAHSSGGLWPGMVALVTRGVDGAPIGIHRTFLAHGGAGKAPVDPQKMMKGPCAGGAVRLAEPGDVLLIGEGIETCLAAAQATGYPAWAALSTSGLTGLELPADIRDVMILADADPAGEKAALNAARRWKGEGRRVRIARPPAGQDFNDLLIAKGAL
jgi:hypothetical protein